MLSNYFKLAWRNLAKHRQFTFLNLVGLSTGLACALLIYLWVNDELKVDKFHQHDDRLMQVKYNIPLQDGSIMTSDHTPGLLAQTLKAEMPEVEDAAVAAEHFENDTKGVIITGAARIKASERYVSNNFFDVFSYSLLKGDKRKPLTDKFSVLLSDELALKLFNTTENIIGKTIEWDRGEGWSGRVSGTYTVSGIFKKPPVHSSARFDMLFSYDHFFDKYSDNLSHWTNSSSYTYILLKVGADKNAFANKLHDFSKRKVLSLYGEEQAKHIGTLFLQRYSDKYLYNHFENGIQSGGRISYVRLFSIIAVFILLIACINFMNLSTAKASGRIKEVGVKKVMGASRSILIGQYLSESVLMSLLSIIPALVLTILLLPAFNQLTGKELSLSLGGGYVLPILGIILLTGLISGSYPALYLSKFKPVAILKGRLKNSVGELLVRKGLVVFQFALSMIFIVSVLVIYRQMNLIQTRNLGYNKDNVIQFAKEGNLRKNLSAFLQQTRSIPGVVAVSSTHGDMMGNVGGTGGVEWEGKNPDTKIEFGALWVDVGYIELMGINMADGRPFSTKFGSDSLNVVFNEAAIAAMGLKDPVGKTIKIWGAPHQIIGVAKNFHFESMHQQVRPLFFKYNSGNGNLVVKIKAGKERETIASLEAIYKKFNQGLPFEYTFIDENFQKLYASEQRVAVLSGWFAGIAVIISCLGLFGLAAFTAQKRQKEIGIRKVVGASAARLVMMLSKDFVKLVLIAILIAFPVSWWIANAWLSDFAYRVGIGADIFVVAGISILLITLITISFQSIRAALANPIDALRSE